MLTKSKESGGTGWWLELNGKPLAKFWNEDSIDYVLKLQKAELKPNQNKVIIIARCKSEAARYAQLNGIDGFYHVSKPEHLRGIVRGSSYAITPEFNYKLSGSDCRELNEMIFKRGLVRYELG